MKKVINVVGAIIEDSNKNILCALRSPIMALSDLWEFPGGKVEQNESLEDAVVREIKEELDCIIEPIEIFRENRHEYERIVVNLITIKCRLLSGIPTKSEHAALLWLKRSSLNSLKWAPADMPTVQELIKEGLR